MEAVNKSMAKGAMWTILFKFVTRGIGLISTVILARLLVPADFGLVAMAMAIIAALDLLSSFSFDTVLIQNPDSERKHYDTAWTFNFIAGAVQALILVVIAPLIANFYDQPRLQLIVYLLAFGRLVAGAENIGMVAFRKDLQFHKDFKFQIIKKMAGFTITMILAFWLRSYWALIGGMLAGTFAGVALSFAMQSYRPRFSLAALSELFHFSKWLLINNGFYFAIHESSSFILGKLGGASALGLFTVSYEISNLPSTELVAPINRAIFPGYAKMAGDLAVLRQGYLNVFSAIALFVLPIGAGLALTADPLVHLMLGARWEDAIPLIQILAIAGVIAALGTNQGAVYLALGRPKVLTFFAALHTVLLLPLLIWGAMRNGAMGAAEATLFVGVIGTPINYWILLKSIELRFSKFAEVLWRPLAASTVMIVVVKLLLEWAPTGNTFLVYLAQLLLASIVGGCVYVAAIVLLWKSTGMKPGIEQTLLTRITSRFKPKVAKDPHS